MISPKTMLGIVLLPLLLLWVPFVAMRYTTGVAWTASDFVFAWVLLAGAGLTYHLVIVKSERRAYRVAVAVATGTCLLLVVVNGAVGIIGSERNPANLLYGAVLAVTVIGAGMARLGAKGMSRAMYTAALVQIAVPVVALLFSRDDFEPGVLPVFCVNAGFALAFLGSALLFRSAESVVGARNLHIA